MRKRLIDGGSGALWLGLIVSAMGAIADFLVLDRPIWTGPAAFYFLVGGIAGWGYGVAFGRVIPPLGAGLLVASCFSLYPLNISWLAGEPWASGTSLALDTLVLAICLGVILILRTITLRPAPARGTYAFSALGLMAGATFTIFSGASPTATDKSGSGPDILLLVLDSVRRDHVNFLGYARPTSGRFDPYLPQARVYENGYATASWTFPSTLDILGVRWGQDAGSGFPAPLAKLGYATLLLSDNPHLTGPPASYFGFEEKLRGVPDWRYRMTGSIAAVVLDRFVGGNDRRLADRLALWVQGRRGPVYVHAHLMNAHTPFKFPPIDLKKRSGRRIEFPVSGQRMTEDERDSIVARYDEGVRTSFAAAWRMIETMRGRRRPLLVLLTADHGELLGERGEWFHGTGLSEELLRVPIVAWGEGVVPGRVSGLASNAQLAETILAAARGVYSPGDLRTSDGVEQVEGGLPGTAAFRIRTGYKVVVSKAMPLRLFRLSREGETDVTALEPERARLLAADLSLSASQVTSPSALDDVTREVLRSLGYIR